MDDVSHVHLLWLGSGGVSGEVKVTGHLLDEELCFHSAASFGRGREGEGGGGGEERGGGRGEGEGREAGRGGLVNDITYIHMHSTSAHRLR